MSLRAPSSVATGSTPDAIRRHNVSLALRQLHVRGSVSRAELTTALGLNRSTIKAIVAELVESGLVTEDTPTRRVGVGRPSHVMTPLANGPYVLAAGIGVDSVSVAAVGLGGTILRRRDLTIPPDGITPTAMAALLAKQWEGLRRRLPSGAQLAGLGVSLPAVLRSDNGYVELSPNLGWQAVDFGSLLQERVPFGLPIRFGNDANAGALAEHVWGAGRDTDNLVYIAGEVGVGGGIIVNGRIISGVAGFAGELGHVSLNPLGRLCRCGNVGCLETEVGEEALLRAAGETEHGPSATQEVLRRASNGDLDATRALHHVAQWLGRGIGLVANMLNPELVVFGGPLAEVFRAAESEVWQSLRQHSLAAVLQSLRMAAAGLGQDSSMLGAAELGFADLLSDPIGETVRLRRSS